MLTRRSLTVSTGVGLLMAAASNALAADKPKRVGVLLLTNETLAAPYRKALIDALTALGWREGQNIDYRFAHADGDVTRLPGLLAGLVAQAPDVLFISTPQALRAARSTQLALPIVFPAIGNLVANGFVASLSRPGGNMTGLSAQNEDLAAKLIELLHEAAPKAQRFAVLLNESNPSHMAFWAAMQGACVALKLVPLRAMANTPAQLSDAVAQLVRQRAQAVVVYQDAVFLSQRVPLQELLRAAALPAVFGYREHVVLGGLMSYGANLIASFGQAAGYVDKILRGAAPGDLPVQQPLKFDLSINLRTARELGLTLPQTVLLRADELID